MGDKLRGLVQEEDGLRETTNACAIPSLDYCRAAHRPLERRIGKHIMNHEPTNATATRNFLADAMSEGQLTYRIAEDPADGLALPCVSRTSGTPWSAVAGAGGDCRDPGRRERGEGGSEACLLRNA
jgi:hypothetical protein